MYYESIKDMFLDNRRGLEKELKGAKPAVKDAALNAYDCPFFLNMEVNHGIPI